MVKLAPGYNSDDTKSKVGKGVKPAKASKGVTGFKGATGGPKTGMKGGKGRSK